MTLPKKVGSGFPLPLFSKKAEKAFLKKELRCNPSRRENLFCQELSILITISNHQLPPTPFCAFCDKKIHFYPFNPFHLRSKSDNPLTSTNTLLDFSNFSNPCSKSLKRTYHQKNPFLFVQSVSSAFQKRQPINFHRHPFVTKKSLFIRSIRFIRVPKATTHQLPSPFCAFCDKFFLDLSNFSNLCSKSDNPSTFTNTLLCLL